MVGFTVAASKAIADADKIKMQKKRETEAARHAGRVRDAYNNPEK